MQTFTRLTEFSRRVVIAGVIGFSLESFGADWFLEGGPVVRGGMEVRVGGSSYVQQLGLHAAPGPLTEPGSVGGRYAYADRLYDDGYVKLDAGTLNPNAVGGPGNTWNWSYQNAGQYNAAAQSLTFSKQGDVGYSTTLNRRGSGSEDMAAPGVELVTGWTVKNSSPWRVDLCVGFEGVWGGSADLRQTTYREMTARLTVQDRYGVADTVDPVSGFPGPNHRNGVADPFNTPGPVITNVPSARTTTRQDLSTAQNDVRLEVDQDFYEVFFSPRVSYAASEHWTFQVSPRVGVSYVDASVNRKEVFTQTMAGGGTATLGSWRDRQDESKWSCSAGLMAGAEVALGRGYHLGVFGGYDWVVNELRMHVGPSTVALDGSGFVGGLVFGKRF